MASDDVTRSSPSQSTGKVPAPPPKLPRLPKRKDSTSRGLLPYAIKLTIPLDARIQKRPIVRPPIASPYASASKQKIVYVSTHTPFIPTIKRVRKLLEEADKRAIGPLNLLQGKGNEKQKFRRLTQKVEEGRSKRAEEVVLKATGRAIERVLGMALYFQGQPDCKVRIRTGTVGVVDDIVEGDGQEEDREEELPESRVRKTSVVEIAVTLK